MNFKQNLYFYHHVLVWKSLIIFDEFQKKKQSLIFYENCLTKATTLFFFTLNCSRIKSIMHKLLIQLKVNLWVKFQMFLVQVLQNNTYLSSLRIDKRL